VIVGEIDKITNNIYSAVGGFKGHLIRQNVHRQHTCPENNRGPDRMLPDRVQVEFHGFFLNY